MHRDIPLLGRDSELELVADAFNGSRRGVFIVARPGWGKSRLATEAAHQIGQSDVQLVRVEATRSAQGTAFGAFASHLRDDTAASGLELSESVVLVGAIENFRRVYGTQRYVVIVEDCEHLDECSAVLLRHLVLGGQAFAIATARDDRALPDAIDAMVAGADLDRIDLSPLDHDGIEQFCAHAVGGRVDTPTLRRLGSLCAGNLAYLRELLIDGRASGSLVADDRVWSWLGPIVPGPRLSHLVMSSLRDFDANARRVLELLSIGGAIEYEALLRLVPGEAAATALHAGVVETADDRRRDVVRLSEPLVGVVLSNALRHSAIRGYAAEIADALRHTGSRRERDSFRISVLELRAERDQDSARLLDAAKQARALDDLESWESLARAAVASNGRDEARMELEECLVWQGRFAELDPSAMPADTKPEILARDVRIRAATLFFGRGDAHAASSLLRSVEEAIAPHPMCADVRSHRAELAMFGGAFQLAEQLALDVLAADDAPAVARATAFGALVPSLALTGRVDEARSSAATGLDFMLGHDDPLFWEGAGVVVGDFLAAMISGCLAELGPTLEALYAEAAAKPLDPMRGVWALMIGRSALARGDLANAVERLAEAAGLLRRNDPGRVLPWCLGALAQAEGQRSNPDAAIRAVAEMDREQVVVMRATEVDMVVGRAWATAASGNIDRARDIALECARGKHSDGAYGAAMIAYHEAFRFGARDLESDWCRLAPNVQGRLIGPLERASKALAGGDVDGLLDANAALRECQMNLWAAEIAGIATVEADVRHNQVAGTRAIIAASGALSGCTDARTPVLLWAEARVATTRLSARELEISELAADGLTSAAIGERLFLSRRTVENHLAAAYRKLGVSSRADLTAILRG